MAKPFLRMGRRWREEERRHTDGRGGCGGRGNRVVVHRQDRHNCGSQSPKKTGTSSLWSGRLARSRSLQERLGSEKRGPPSLSRHGEIRQGEELNGLKKGCGKQMKLAERSPGCWDHVWSVHSVKPKCRQSIGKFTREELEYCTVKGNVERKLERDMSLVSYNWFSGAITPCSSVLVIKQLSVLLACSFAVYQLNRSHFSCILLTWQTRSVLSVKSSCVLLSDQTED